MAISAGRGRAGLAAWAAGLDVKFVLVREKHLPAGELVEACQEVRAAVQPGTRMLVAGGRVDVALAAGADGVHLGSAPGELTTGHVRRLWPEAWVSVSCHSLAEVRCARGVSSILFGPVFGKQNEGVEVVPGVGLAMLSRACHAADGVPVFALGGVTERNAADCMRAGAAGVAAIRMFQAPFDTVL